MSEQRSWGRLHVYLYDDFVRVYSYVGMGGMICVEYRLNVDGSLAELSTNKKLIPSEYWHEVSRFIPRIKTYLMLKGCV